MVRVPSRGLIRLHNLAVKKGLALERAWMPDTFHLIDIDGGKAKAPNGSLAFSIDEARVYLLRLPDKPPANHLVQGGRPGDRGL